MKTEREILQELANIVVETFSDSVGANSMMLKPALNIVKIKLSQMSDEDGVELCDKIHFISHYIEKESGKLSPYHGLG